MCIRHFFRRTDLLIASIVIFLSVSLVSCGSDEPSNPSEDNPTEEVTPDDENSSDIPDQSDQEEGDEENGDDENNDVQPPAGNESNYFIPTENDFMGKWQAYWLKKEIYWARDGKWKKTETEILERPSNSTWGWAYKIGFLNDKYGYLCLIWGDAVSRLEEIIEAVMNGEETTISNVVINHGSLLANYYKCNWYEEAGNGMSMLVLMDNKNKVQYRWNVSQFDGETFTATPAFNDLPPYKDGEMTILNSYKFRKI